MTVCVPFERFSDHGSSYHVIAISSCREWNWCVGPIYMRTVSEEATARMMTTASFVRNQSKVKANRAFTT